MITSCAPYQELCTEYYELDKPKPPADALAYYLHHAQLSNGPILEPMCGSGRFLLPILQQGVEISGFDPSEQMVTALHRKAAVLGLRPTIQIASFATVKLDRQYGLIMIPAGSFSLLNEAEMTHALVIVRDHLLPNGTFLLEVDTPNAIHDPDREWCGSWVSRPNGSKIVLSKLARFNETSSVETTLCRYELWESNEIVRTQVEEINLRFLPLPQVEELLKRSGLVIQRRIVPYTRHSADEYSPNILFECIKA